MEVGLLWYDDDPRRGLEDKVERAAQRYREKHGRWPNTCYVHSRTVLSQAEKDRHAICGAEGPQDKIRLVPAPNILLHHYWLGVSAKKTGHKTMQAVS